MGRGFKAFLLAALLVLGRSAEAQYVSLGGGSSTPTTAAAIGSALYCEDAGGDDTYVCTLDPAATTLDKLTITMKVTTGNTGAATVNVSGLGVKSIKKAQGGVTTDPADNDIRAGAVVILSYDGTNFQLQSTLGNAAAGGGVTVGDAVASGTANRVLYEDASNQVAESADLSFDGTKLQVGSATTASNSILQMNRTISGASATSNFLNVTGTLPGTLTANTYGLNIPIATSAGTDNYDIAALKVDFTAGYTGSGQSVAGRFVNTIASGAGAFAGLDTFGSIGVVGSSSGSGVVKMGGFFQGSGGSGSSGGVMGVGTDYGGYFRLGTTTISLFGAVVADNGASAANIAVFADNGTAVVTIADGGVSSFGNATTAGNGTSIFRPTISGASATSNFLNITGTLTSAGALAAGFRTVITGSGSGQAQYGALFNLLAGYTGVSETSAFAALNNSAGTMTTYGNSGATIGTSSSTTGTNWGVVGYAANGGAGQKVGVLATLQDLSAVQTTAPGASMALLADNGLIAADIAQFRDNGTAVFRIGDGGTFNVVRTLTGAGTTGAQTINLPQGSVNVAAAAATLVVTNSMASATSLIFLTPQTADATCTAFAAVRAAGSFTITANAACTAETAVAFWVTGAP